VEPEISIQQPITLSGFCKTVITNCSANWPPSEGTIVQEFVRFFEINEALNLETLESICRKLEINVSQQQLPYPLRGHNCHYQKKREIVVGTVSGTAEYLGITEHTLLHELRELIEYEFRKEGHPVAASAVDLESRAELFASEVRSFASMKMWEWLLEGAASIESRFWQIVAIVAVGALMTVHHFSFLNLPQWEDQLTK
jgi:hypothetical protein